MVTVPFYKNTHGFTLIEMMVALSVFTIVVTIAVGAFLSLIGSSKGIQNKQSVMTTLTFVLDSMSREIRTGTDYYCDTNEDFDNQESLDGGNDCENGGNGISFLESGSSLTSKNGVSDRIAYYYDSADESIMRRIGNVQEDSIVSEGITITSVQFFVTGTDRLGDGVSAGTDAIQPTVTIVLEAQDDTGVATILQTTVTQRELDI